MMAADTLTVSQRSQLAAQLFPNEWAAAAKGEGPNASNARRRLRKRAEAAAALRHQGVPCPYCGGAAVFHQTSNHLYGRDYGPVWHCAPCGAWVGCHPGGKPLGRLANKALRDAKVAAHAAFDPLWQAKQRRDSCSKAKARGAGYKWLADQLGIDRKDCHIGMFTVEQCSKVVEVCAAFRTKVRT
jgi:hypothetical protein